MNNSFNEEQIIKESLNSAKNIAMVGVSSVKKEDKSKPSAADSDEPEFVIPDDG